MLLAGAANSALVSVVPEATAPWTVSQVGSDIVRAEFNLSASSLVEELTFTTSGLVNIVLAAFPDTGSGSQAQLSLGGTSVAPGPDVPLSANLGNNANFNSCVLGVTGGNCYRIGGSGVGTGTTLYQNLAAGTYTFSFGEGSGGPNSGILELRVSAVPVPAAGVLFGSALLGAAFARRRKLQQSLGLPQ